MVISDDPFTDLRLVIFIVCNENIVSPSLFHNGVNFLSYKCYSCGVSGQHVITSQVSLLHNV